MKNFTNKLFVVLLISFSLGDQLFWEDFSNDEIPPGWQMEPNWQVGSQGYQEHVVGDPPPGAFFYYSPTISENYERAMTTPIIYVGEETEVVVEFFFELDFWSAGNATNGLRIEYLTGGEWVQVLGYEISPTAGDVDLSGRYESFTAEIDGDFKIRWVAYGTNSNFINSWDVDNVSVVTLPKLTSVTIESSNVDPSTAFAGTNIWLNFTADSEFESDPYVQINGNACNIDNLGGSSWVAYYTVQESDPDGPLQFTIDFTDVNGTEGKTVKETTDQSTVIVDNSPPPPFTVGTVTSSGGNVAADIWNSTNTQINLEVNIPEDSAVTSFNYTMGNSLSFDGTNDEVIIPGNTDYQASEALTVEAWIKPNSWTDNEGILSYAKDQGPSKAGFGFVYFATGWRFYLKTTTNSIDYITMAELSTPVGQWTHLAATYDGERVRVYRNGTVLDSADAMGAIEWTGAPSDVRIGSFKKAGATGYFDGQIDEVRIWDIVRSGAQIKASKEITINNDETGLVGYWRMDAGSGTTATDSTASANHGTLSGPSWVIEDSPINFQTSVWDTDVIVGSMFQLRGRINTNEFEAFGDKDTITVDDLNAGTKTVSAPSDAFETLADFGHEKIAQLSALLYDVVGNYSLGDTSTTNTVIDILANSPSPVSISSNNTFSHLAKTGDVVTITMTYDEDVATPAVTVDGNNADEVTDLGSEQFSSTYTTVGSETEGSLPFTITTTDYLGNDGTHLGSTDGSTVVYDRTNPVVSPVSIQSTNADSQWAKIGDTIRVDFGGNEILYETSATLAGSAATLYDTTETEYVGSSECVGGEIVTDNLKLWLDANDVDGDGASEGMGESTLNGSEVVVWADKSGNGADVIEVEGQGLPNLVQNQFNGQSTLQFSREGQDVLVHDLGADKWVASEYSLFIVFQMVGTPQDYDSFFSNGDINNGNHFQITQLNGVFKFLSEGSIDFEPWDNDLKLYGVIANSEGTSTIVDGNVANSASNTNGRNFDKYKINWNRLSFQYSDSYIAEVMLYDRELTDTELTKNYKYLGNKYGQSFTDDSTVVYTEKEMNASDPEGKVAINIDYNDCAGNDGTTITETTDGSYVIFDMSPPSDFTVGTVTATNGNVVENAWNSTNTGLDVTVPVESDTTLKNGWIQVWAKVGSNAFEELGDSSDIAGSEVGTDKTISFTADQVEAITGFTEEDTITIKAVMFDRPGNQTEGSQSTNRLVIDQISPTITSSHIESNNADSTKAKVDDIITLTLQMDVLIQTPTMTIAGGAGSVTDLGSFTWSGTYTMTETDDEGVVTYTVNEILDTRGNPTDGFTATSDGSQVVFDRTKPSLDQVNAQTYNAWNQQWALVDDYGRLYINASEDLLSIGCTFNDLVTTDHQYGPDEYDLGYTFSATDEEGLISFEIAFVDSAGNSGDTVRATTDNTFIIFDQTPPSDFTVGDVSATGGNVVANVWNSTNTGLDVIVPIDSDTTLDSGRVQIWAKVGSNSFEMLGDSAFILSSEVGATKTMSIPGDSVRAITGYAENDTITVKAFMFDIPGNETEGTESATKLLIDETPPSLVSVSYESNFSDSSLATVGHVITLTFETDVEIQTPTASISNNSATISDLGNNRWTGTYTMQESDEDGIIPFQINSLTDSRGNPTEGTNETTDGTQVTFDNTQPTLSLVNIESNNADSSWAKVGDTVTVAFKGNELLSDQSVTIVNQTATITSTGSANFYSLSFDGIDDFIELPDGIVASLDDFTFECWFMTNANAGWSRLMDFGSSTAVNMFLTPSFSGTNIPRFGITTSGSGSEERITSSSELNQGQWYHIAVTINNSTNTGKMYIDGILVAQNNSMTLSPSSLGNTTNNYFGKSQYNDPYLNGMIDEVSVWNNALTEQEIQDNINSQLSGNETGLVGYWNFNEGSGSVVYDQSGSSNDGTINGATWNTDIPINKKYYAKYVMTETDPEGEVPFEIVVTDSVGLVSNPITSTTDNSVVIFDRTAPTLSMVHIESNNTNNILIAIEGDEVYLTFTPEEPLIMDSIVVTIGGEATTLTESDGTYTATLVMSGDEPEGILDFTIDFKDRAGNPGIQVTTTTDESYVNHDVYPPEIETTSIASNGADTSWAKVGDSVFVTFTASEVLDNITITIAGVSADYDELSLTKYQAYHVMEETNDEGGIPFLITYSDLGGATGPDADSTTNNSRVRFDKTLPELYATGMATNNEYGDSLAGIGTVDTLSFTISEAYRDLNVELSGDTKTPTEDGLNFIATHTFTATDPEGWVTFSIAMTDSAGNPSDTLTTTQDGSQVRFDGTPPTLPFVTFFSNNSLDTTLCIVGDTLVLQYTAAETLRASTITIAGSSPNETSFSSGKYRAAYEMTGSEAEGFIPFSIYDLEDWVGNIGDMVNTTTNGSSVLFDMTPPADFTVGSVASKEGVEVSGYWNASNETLEVIVPVANDETLPEGGIQLQSSFGGDFFNLADTVLIEESDLGTDKIISVSETDFESVTDFAEGGNATFQALLWDKAGNTTMGTTSTSNIHIDETLPTLETVIQRTNNAIGDSLAKVGDKDTLSFMAAEGLDSLTVQILNQDVTTSGANRDWTSTYTFQETDTDGIVNFNIVFSDTAGNMGTEVSATTDGSQVRFDGTNPTLASVVFSSTNTLNNDLAIIGDTLFLDFMTDEDLYSSDVTIAGFDADTTFEITGRTPYRSWRIINGDEDEGYISFVIVYTDLVGNIGDTIETTTDESSVLFDMTPPADFDLGAVTAQEGVEISGYWNASNQRLIVSVPVDNDETLPGGGVQLQSSFGGSYADLSDTFLIEESNLGTEKIISASADDFEGIADFVEDGNATFQALLWDKAGNTTTGTVSTTTIHIDETLPTLSEISLYSDNELDSTWAKISDQVSLNFSSSEGLASANAVLALDSLTGTGTNSGLTWTITKTVTVADAEDTILFNISFLDTAGNAGEPVTSTSDGSFLILDKTTPTVANLLEGNDGLDIDYYNKSDSITLYWNSFDSLAGVRDGYVALGTDSNSTDIVNWTLTPHDSVAGLGGLNLANDGIYFGGVFIRDSAGNHSDTIWGNSIYIDIQDPDTGSIMDAYWVMDLDYTSDSTRLSYIWSNFTDNTEIDYFELAIGTGEDTTNVLDWVQTDSTDSMTITGLNLVRDTLYYTYIRATDLATNQSITTRTDGIYFDDTFPVVNKITPDVIADSAGFLSVLNQDTLTIKFNRPIYVYDLSVKSVVDTNFTVSHDYGDSVVTVIWTDTLASYDTLTIIIDSAVAYNTLWVTDTLQFFSKLWADLNDDYDITVDDILVFNQTWPETDLGPFNDDPPHVRPTPDGEANLTDLAAFGKMWHWRFFNLDFDTSLVAAKISEELSFHAQGNEMVITIPKNAYTAEILMGESNLNVMDMKMLRPTSTAFMFTATDTATGLIKFSMADHRGFDSTLTLILPETGQEFFQTHLQYEFKNESGKVLQKGFTYVDVEILPEKFSVYNNYPNPFNPVTTIRYDLPEMRDVNIVIYDLLGRTVRALDLNATPAGRHQFKWYGTNNFGNKVSTGIYFLQLSAGQDRHIQKMLLLK